MQAIEMFFGMVATAPKETLSNMEQMPMKLFLETLAVFAVKRFLEQSYVGAIVIYLDYSYVESIYCFTALEMLQELLGTNKLLVY